MAASALGVLLISGAAVYAGVRATLQEKQDEALVEITRTEIESPTERESVDPPEVSATDESILVWDATGGEVLLERGPISLRTAIRPTSRPEFLWLNLAGKEYRALYYPYEESGKRAVALCVEPSAPLQSALSRIALRFLLIGLLGAAVTCLIAWLLSTRLTRPLQQIAERAADIQESALSRRLPPLSRDAELIAVTDGINAMLARLESAFIAQRRFVADAAHELRSPLANLRTTAEVALRRPDAETRERALRLTVSEIERLTRLTESLLTLSLADAGTLVEERSPVDLGAIAEESVEAIRSRAEGQGVEVSLTAEPASLSGDALRLRQVFDNLLDNALQHAPPSGSRVKVSVERRDGAIFATVTDDGPGILNADLPHVFERLWRADVARARATGGFGLGLATVKAIVEAHGGNVNVFSAPSEETTFQLCFPSESVKL